MVDPTRPVMTLAILCAMSLAIAGCKREPEPTGPTLESVAPDEGILTVRFPNPPPGARVQVYGRSVSATPERFPVRIAVPLGHQFTVMAWAPHDGRFDTTITVAKYTGRQGEVVIEFPDGRSAGRFGLYRSDLPTELGYVPLPAPLPGEPAATMFEIVSGGAYYMEGMSWHFLLDQHGDVWRGEADADASVPRFLRLGTIQPAVRKRLLALAPGSTLGEFIQIPECGICYDCGGSSLRVFGRGDPSAEGTVIAGAGAGCQIRNAAEAKTVTAWMVALRNQAWPQMPDR